MQAGARVTGNRPVVRINVGFKDPRVNLVNENDALRRKNDEVEDAAQEV